MPVPEARRLCRGCGARLLAPQGPVTAPGRSLTRGPPPEPGPDSDSPRGADSDPGGGERGRVTVPAGLGRVQVGGAP